jgi:hypothetical protein
MGATEWGKPRQGRGLLRRRKRGDGEINGDAGALVGGIFGEDDDAGV